MNTFLLVFFILSSLVGWVFFWLECLISRARKKTIESYDRTCEALRSQNARLIQTVAMYHRGIEVESKRIEEFKLEDGR